MKVLTFSAYYTPEIAASLYLTEDTFEALVENDCEISLFVPTPTRGITADIRKEYKKIKYEEKYGGKLKINRFALYGEGRNTLLRALRYLFLEIAFFFKGLGVKADVIYIQSTPPIHGLMAAFLKKIKKIPFVYNLQDIFPDSLVNTGLTTKGSFIWKIGRWIERITYNAADEIIVISEGFKKNIMEKGVSEDKITVVPNWVNANEVVSVPREQNDLFDRYNLDRNKFYICYSGNIGYTQNMDMLVDCAEKLKENCNIGFIIVGDGAYKPQLEQSIAEKQLSNITLIPFQDYSEISKVFSLGDVGLIISKSGVGTNSVPSKTWSIMSARRPVLASFDEDSELCEIVKNENCGACVLPDDATALKETILNLNKNRSVLADMGNRGREYILNNLTKEICTEKYVSVINGCRSDYK